MRNFLPLLLTVLLGLTTTVVQAQCFMHLELDDRLQRSDLVVTARILESEPFYNEFGLIATRHLLSVYESWNGVSVPTTISLVTLGGQINEEITRVEPNLTLQPHEVGVFLLQAREGEDYAPLAARESFIKVDTAVNQAYDAGYTFTSLAELRDRLLRNLQEEPIVYERLTYDRTRAVARSFTPGSITFTPTTINAGTGEVLTINGTGFGASQGTVFIDDPDDGPGGNFGAIPDNDIISWSNTQIRLTVTGKVGTGRIIVRDATNDQGVSASDITIPYNVTNVIPVGSASENTFLIDEAHDGDGGYRFLLSNSTANGGVSLPANTAAEEALTRAIDTWHDDLDFAFYAGSGCGTTSVQTPGDDGINLISFDNNAFNMTTQLGLGVVGVAISTYSSCGTSNWEVTDLDIFFLRQGRPLGGGSFLDWNFGPGPPNAGEVDFESIALHEIGHTHQLSHVNGTSEVMTFALNTGTSRRNLTTNDINPAFFERTISLNYNPPIINCNPANDFPFIRPYETYLVSEECNVLLPVELLSFQGRATPNGVLLEWETANEINNAGFRVLRALTSEGRTFQSLDFVPGLGPADGTNRYAYLDRTPRPGTNFYRLDQEDFDGTLTPSPVVMVRFDDNSAPDDLTLLGNPVDAAIRVTFPPRAEARNLRFWNAAGKQLQRLVIGPGSEIATINTAGLPSGLYFLQLAAGQVQRVVVR